jgi:uncharacterized protein YggT (Ycf19 family)
MIVQLLCGVTQLAVLAIIARVIFQITETMLGPVRRALPLAGPLDLSPIVVILFLQIVVQRLILNC